MNPTGIFHTKRSQFANVAVLTLFLGHVGIALVCKWWLGINIEHGHHWAHEWDWFWQNIPHDLLRDDLLRSVWHLHSQPPLYNLYGAFFIRIFSPDHLPALQYANIMLGALIVGMVYCIAGQFIRNILVRFLGALVFSMTPALVLFEAFALYTLLTMFWVITALWSLASFQDKKHLPWLYLFIISLNGLILTRSLYHIIILVIGIGIGGVLANKHWKRFVIMATLISAVTVGWYSKNSIVFGFWGSSSWMGLNLWNRTTAGYAPEELAEYAEQGRLDRVVVDQQAFSKPAEYGIYGFNATTTIPILARNDYHNINIPAISRLYWQNAVRLISAEPLRYLHKTLELYMNSTRPSSEFFHPFAPPVNTLWMGYEKFCVEFLQGTYVFDLLGVKQGSFLAPLLLVSLIAYFAHTIGACKASCRQWSAAIRAAPTAFFTALLILYTLSVGCLFEAGENIRFKFPIEPLMWLFVLSTIAQNFYSTVIQQWVSHLYHHKYRITIWLSGACLCLRGGEFLLDDLFGNQDGKMTTPVVSFGLSLTYLAIISVLVILLILSLLKYCDRTIRNQAMCHKTIIRGPQ